MGDYEKMALVAHEPRYRVTLAFFILLMTLTVLDLLRRAGVLVLWGREPDQAQG
jgi:hypothetical protein